MADVRIAPDDHDGHALWLATVFSYPKKPCALAAPAILPSIVEEVARATSSQRVNEVESHRDTSPPLRQQPSRAPPF